MTSNAGSIGVRERALVRLAWHWARLNVPGKGRLMRREGVVSDAHWAGAPPRATRLRWHGYSVTLDPSEKFERMALFLRRYHELPLQLLMMRTLRPGDAFVDVGANVGLVTLLASWLVGSGGRVVSFEPNPEVCARAREHLARNGVSNVLLREEALGAAPGELELSVIGANTGSGTLGKVPPPYDGQVTRRYRVPVVRGDDVLEGVAPAMVKIDAEGAETSVVRGMLRTLAAHRPLVVTEINPFALRMNGSTPEELWGVMEGLGYRPAELQERRRALVTWVPTLTRPRPVGAPGLRDVVWAHPDSRSWKDARRWAEPGALDA